MRRLGHEPTAAELAEFDPEALAAIFSERPALHRYPRAMAARVQELARLIVTDFDGDPAALWSTAPTGAELYKQIAALPGFGPQKAKIFVALLGKQLAYSQLAGARRRGRSGPRWTRFSVADITDEDSLGRCAPISNRSSRRQGPGRPQSSSLSVFDTSALGTLLDGRGEVSRQELLRDLGEGVLSWGRAGRVRERPDDVEAVVRPS